MPGLGQRAWQGNCTKVREEVACLGIPMINRDPEERHSPRCSRNQARQGPRCHSWAPGGALYHRALCTRAGLSPVEPEAWVTSSTYSARHCLSRRSIRGRAGLRTWGACLLHLLSVPPAHTESSLISSRAGKVCVMVSCCQWGPGVRPGSVITNRQLRQPRPGK